MQASPFFHSAEPLPDVYLLCILNELVPIVMTKISLPWYCSQYVFVRRCGSGRAPTGRESGWVSIPV